MDSKKCKSNDVALKSFFLGPQSENSSWLMSEIVKMFEKWFDWRRDIFPADGKCISRSDQKNSAFMEKQKHVSDLLGEISDRFEEDTPKFSPRYIGHMVSEMGMPGVLGHIQALLHNPNHASVEVSKVSKEFEQEAIQDLGKMLGFQRKYCVGHFTSGGTIANFEAVSRALFKMDQSVAVSCAAAFKAGETPQFPKAYHLSWDAIEGLVGKHELTKNEIHDWSYLHLSSLDLAAKIFMQWQIEYTGPNLLVPMNKHYSWLKAAHIFGVGEKNIHQIPLDEEGRQCFKSLKAKISDLISQSKAVSMVVSVAGTTELGKIDPVDEISGLLKYYNTSGTNIWHHVDAAYGGYFCSALDGKSSSFGRRVRDSLKGIGLADSITLDPHKLGYVPYACGAFISKDKKHYSCAQSPAPYLEVPGVVDTQWAHTLEGSRPATGAMATWLSSKSLGLNSKGYGSILDKSAQASIQLSSLLKEVFGDKVVLLERDTNVSCFFFNVSKSLSENNRLSREVFEKLFNGKEYGVSQTSLLKKTYEKLFKSLLSESGANEDESELFLIRCVTMNPFLTSSEPNVDYLKDFVNCLRRELNKAMAKSTANAQLDY